MSLISKKKEKKSNTVELFKVQLLTSLQFFSSQFGLKWAPNMDLRDKSDHSTHFYISAAFFRI